MRSSIQSHIGEEFGLVNLTSLRTGDSNADGNLVFNQIRQIVAGTVTGGGLTVQISFRVYPFDAVIDEKYIRFVPFGMRNHGKWKAPRCRLGSKQIKSWP
jgi:hypothetical protein